MACSACSALLSMAVLAALAVGAQSWDPDCIREPVGFGQGTVGGQGGIVVTPKNNKELKKFLSDATPRVIRLDKTFDFTGSEGTTEELGCIFLRCKDGGDGFQYSRIKSGTCDGREGADIAFDTAGLKPLTVASRKTIMGVDGKGVIRGKGLQLKNAENVIIRDLSIVDINPSVVWGGDALSFKHVDKVWVHNVTFKNVGRQFLVTYQMSNTGITVSSCTFDGNTPNSPYCNGAHYWVWLFYGTDDRITLINNRILHTSGRLPHAGGYSGAKSFVHIVGNHFDSNSHVAVEPYEGAVILSEGNRFHRVNGLISTQATQGQLFMANNAEQSALCRVTFGEACLANTFSETTVMHKTDVGVLAAGAQLGVDAVNNARRAVCL